MNKIFISLVILTFICMGGGFFVEADTGLYPDQVQLSTKRFDPKKNEVFSLSFNSSQSATALVKIYNFLGENIATPFKGKVKKNSTRTVTWDGRDGSGNPLGAGVYYYTITLEKDKAAVVYNPYPQTHGHQLSILEGGYDEKKNEIYFTLPQAAMVRVRVNLKKGGPIMATPLDWTPLPTGEYKFSWDGKDISGLIDIKTHPQRNIMIYAYSLADNSFIVSGESAGRDKPFVVLNESMLAEKEFPLTLPPDRYLHAKKDPRLNRVAGLEVTFPGAELKDGVPVLSDKASVRVTIDPRDQWVAEMSRYELMFYMDTVIVFEDESGFSPFTYYLNTQDLTPGEHVLTVNLLTYDDHYAVVSKKIIIHYDHDKKNP